MKAVGYQQSLPAEHSDSLLDIELEQPQPTGRDLCVEVKAIAVNPVDTKIRQRAEPESGYKVIGWDAAGVVTAVGDEVTGFEVGDEVWYAGALTRQGCNAEYQLVDERIVGRKPKTLSFVEAAALPLTTITAWELLFDRLQIPTLTANSTDKPVLLLTGGAGGVGSILIQLAKQLTNATVIATASRPETQTWVKKLGADYVLDHSKPLAEELHHLGIKDITHGASLTATGQHFSDFVSMLRPQGRLALIDDPAEPVDISLLKQKSLSLHWEFMYTRSMFETADMIEQQRLLNKVAEMVDAGVIQTTIGEHYGKINATNLKKAHQQLESGTTVGKIVLEGF